MSQPAVTFDESRLTFEGDQSGSPVWLTPDGDRLGLFHYPFPPDIYANLEDIDKVRDFYRPSICRNNIVGRKQHV